MVNYYPKKVNQKCQAREAMPYFIDWRDKANEAYFRANIEVISDGTVISCSSTGHMEQAIAATMEYDWLAFCRRIRQPTVLIWATKPFGTDGSQPILIAGSAEQTLAVLANAGYLEVKGNHMTFPFADCAPIVAQEIAGIFWKRDGHRNVDMR